MLGISIDVELVRTSAPHHSPLIGAFFKEKRMQSYLDITDKTNSAIFKGLQIKYRGVTLEIGDADGNSRSIDDTVADVYQGDLLLFGITLGAATVTTYVDIDLQLLQDFDAYFKSNFSDYGQSD